MAVQDLRPTGVQDATGRTAAAGAVWSGACYVAAWLIGLVLAPSAPAPSADAGEVGAHYAQHGAAVLTSSALVHGVAGLSLAAFAVSLATACRSRGALRRTVVGTGSAAALLSVVQVVLAVLAVAVDQDGTALRAFQALNLVDVCKIVLLAAFVASGTTALARAGAARTGLRALAGLLVPLLTLSSAALVVDSSVLMTGLGAALVLLLLWVGSSAAAVHRYGASGVPAVGRRWRERT